jgi:hypothetical protein
VTVTSIRPPKMLLLLLLLLHWPHAAASNATASSILRPSSTAAAAASALKANMARPRKRPVLLALPVEANSGELPSPSLRVRYCIAIAWFSSTMSCSTSEHDARGCQPPRTDSSQAPMLRCCADSPQGVHTAVMQRLAARRAH